MKYFSLLFILLLSCSQKKDNVYIKEIQSFQLEINQTFFDIDDTPLRGEHYENFTGHPFFPIQEKYRIQADYEPILNAEAFEMLTSTGESKTYLPYAKAKFSLDDESYELTLYQSLSLKDEPEYKEYLFLPFKDLSNDIETYAGGRYLDLKIPEDTRIIIDFNKAYQPYCAYNLEDYSCPIVPKENHLNIKIPAGVKYNKSDFEF